MTKQEVFELCEFHGSANDVDPILLLAIAQQESSFLHDVVRLEQGFYHRYTKPLSECTTNEVLYATSYGLLQVMGMSLKEMGFFPFFRESYNARHSFQLVSASSEITVAKGINEFMVRADWQIEYGTKWWKVKLAIAKGDVRKGLLFWNGGGNPLYPDEVIKKYRLLGGKSL